MGSKEIREVKILSSLILDIGVIAVFLLFIIIGFKSGVIKSFVMFAGAIFSSVFAGYCSGKMATFFVERFVLPSIESRILQSMAENSLNFETLCSKLPNFLRFSLASYGITPLSFNHIMVSSTKQEIPLKIAELVEPLFVGIFKYLFSIFIFMILMLIIRFLMQVVLRFFKNKSLKNANSLFGGFFGALKAYIVVSLILCCMRAFLPMMDDVPEVINTNSISSTMIFKEMYFKNPVHDMFQKM